jgi:LytS/YehU family sensor histidine kinase
MGTVELYLALELVRFEDRLTVEREVERDALVYFVPPLALQTLVENALKHGVSRDEGAGVIRISANVNAGRLFVSVRNTGALHGASSIDSTGLGLSNLRTRLRLLFAGHASLELREPERGWVEASLVLPATQTLEQVRT